MPMIVCWAMVDSPGLTVELSRYLAYPRGVHNIGLLGKTFQSLRALMQSALPHLITTAASGALSLHRLGGSRSDRSCHQLDHTSHCTASCFIQLSGRIPVIMLDIHRRRDTGARVEQRRESSPAPPAISALSWLIGLVTRQQRPDNTSILVRNCDRRAVFAATLDQLPYPLAPSVRFASHPAQRRPRSMDKEFAEIAIAPFTNP